VNIIQIVIQCYC